MIGVYKFYFRNYYFKFIKIVAKIEINAYTISRRDLYEYNW